MTLDGRRDEAVIASEVATKHGLIRRYVASLSAIRLAFNKTINQFMVGLPLSSVYSFVSRSTPSLRAWLM